MKYGTRVIVVRGPYADRRAVTVYSHDRRHVYVNLKSGAGIRVSRRDVRLARDQRVTPEEDRLLLRNHRGSVRTWPVRRGERRRRCPCGGRLLWETMPAGGMVVYRTVGKQKVYTAKCDTCHHTMEVTK